MHERWSTCIRHVGSIKHFLQGNDFARETKFNDSLLHHFPNLFSQHQYTFHNKLIRRLREYINCMDHGKKILESRQIT